MSNHVSINLIFFINKSKITNQVSEILSLEKRQLFSF